MPLSLLCGIVFFSDVYQMPSSADFERMRAEIASGVSASDVVFFFSQ